MQLDQVQFRRTDSNSFAGYRVLIGTPLPIFFVHSEYQNILAVIRHCFIIPRYHLRLHLFVKYCVTVLEGCGAHT